MFESMFRAGHTRGQRSPWILNKVGRVLLVAMVMLSLQPAAPAYAANILVTTLMDLSGADGLCSLREAIDNANANMQLIAGQGECPSGLAPPAIDRIRFAGSGTITLDPMLGTLPALSDGRTLIDGWSAPGWAPGNPPPVTIDGSQLNNPQISGITITSAENQVRGLVIVNFALGFGLTLTGDNAADNWVYANALGVDGNAIAAQPNTNGVKLTVGAHDNLIGTNGDGSRDRYERNLISGNTSSGVNIYGADSNIIAGNAIGTNWNGTVAIQNGSGVFIGNGASFNIIGTDSSGDENDFRERNVISGNNGPGVDVNEGTGNVIAGNYIGTNGTGIGPLGNIHNGVQTYYLAVSTQIGTDGDGVADVAERNIISGNTFSGVLVKGQDDVVAGNFIGLDATGNVGIANLDAGIVVGPDVLGSGGPVTIGGLTATHRNVISANGTDGLDISLDDTVVQCNYIGTDAQNSAIATLGNTRSGIVLSADNVVALDNRIGFNGVAGVRDLSPAGFITFSDSDIAGNTDGYILGTAGIEVIVTNNWWGDTSGPTHAGNPGGIGDTVVELGAGSVVTYIPFASAQPNLCGP